MLSNYLNVVVTSYGYASDDNSVRSTLQGKVSGVQVKKAERTKSTTIKRQTNVEFEEDEPYTIKSGNPQTFIDLKKYEMEAEYRYVAIPKLDQKRLFSCRNSQLGSI